jgi:hypothetical protein
MKSPAANSSSPATASRRIWCDIRECFIIQHLVRSCALSRSVVRKLGCAYGPAPVKGNQTEKEVNFLLLVSTE